MEPYRPFVDALVFNLCLKYGTHIELSKEIKAELLMIPVIDTVIDNRKSPLMIAVQRTTASLARSFESGNCEVMYPAYEP